MKTVETSEKTTVIICQCTQLTQAALEAAVAALREEQPGRIITPGAALHKAGVRLQCGGCIPTVVQVLRDSAQTPPHLGARAQKSVHKPVFQNHNRTNIPPNTAPQSGQESAPLCTPDLSPFCWP